MSRDSNEPRPGPPAGRNGEENPGSRREGQGPAAKEQLDENARSTGHVLGPAVGGLLYQTIAPGAPYFAGAAGMFIAAVLALGLPPPPPSRPV